MTAPDFDFDESFLAPQVEACTHENFTIDRRFQKIVELGRWVLEIRMTCANPACRAPMLFQGLPKGLNVAGASTDATGRIGQFVLMPEGESINPDDEEGGPDPRLGMDPIDGPGPRDGWQQ